MRNGKRVLWKMKVSPAVFSCINKHNFLSQKRSNFQEKKMNKTKDFIPQKEMDEAGRKNANLEKVGKVI